MDRTRALLLAAALAAPVRAADLATTAEKTGFRETGRYEEAERLCRAFAEAHPIQVRCSSFGVTPEGRQMLAMAVSADGTLEPADARRARRPVVLVQAGIHSGEIEGKDAGFMLLRDLLEKGSPLFGRVTLVFVPIYNIDGHERFGPDHRINQNGPRESGWRTTAQNLNLNRDYVKAEAPETAAMLRLLSAWDPIIYIDLHTTDGARFRQRVAVMIEPSRAGPRRLAAAGLRLQDELMRRLAHLNPSWFYPSFVREDEPASGFKAGVPTPRFSHGYWARRNRIGVLVEVHSWDDYETRVRSARDAFLALLETAARDAQSWIAAAADADAEAMRAGGVEHALAYEAAETPKTTSFPGYAYERILSEVSGGTWTRYDLAKPQDWRVPLYDELRPSTLVRAPRAGYLVEPAWAAKVAEKLALHGILYQVLTKPVSPPKAELEAWRADKVSFAPPFEGRTQAKAEGRWSAEARSVAAGALFVPMAQPRAPVLMHLLEPDGPDSLLSWGFFNAVFEVKEYMESYVAEEEARRMMAADPALKKEFEDLLAADPAFAASPEKRLDFFYRRHPSWDERHGLYPVYRLRRKP